jgi:uncharacterized protein YbaP (TraB family)
MQRRCFLGALGVAGLVACAGRRPASEQPRSAARGPQLWLAQRAGARVFILGAAEAKDRSWLSAPVERAFTDSRELWQETPPHPDPGDTEAVRKRQAVIDQLGDRPGRSFYDALDPAVRVRAQAYVAELGIDRGEIEPMRPWLAYYTINSAFWRKYRPADALEYPEEVLKQRAAQAGLPLRYEFSTSEDVLRWFAAMTDAAESQYIEMLLDFMDDQKRGLNAAFFGWVDGHPSTRAIDRMRSKTPALYQVLQVERNRWWARNIDRLLAGGGTHFVLVGMNHALGPDGIPAQLERTRVAAPIEVGGMRIPA